MTNKIYITIFATLTLFTTFFSFSCKKEKEYPTYYMDQEFKDYCVFPVGSYWIYEDSVSGKEDSLYLLERNMHISPASEDNPYSIEFFDELVYSSNTNKKLYIQGGVNHGPNGMSYENPLYGKIYEQNVSGGNLKLTYKGDFILINNITYNQVKIFEKLVSTKIKKIYWAKKVGIMRKEIDSLTTWNLKKYYINN